MLEPTRTEFHQDDADQRDIIHNQNYLQIADIKKALDVHTTLQKVTDKTTADKLDKLMPMVDFIPIMKSIVEKENSNRAVSSWAVKVGKMLGFIAFVIGSVATIIGAAWIVISAIIDIKK